MSTNLSQINVNITACKLIISQVSKKFSSSRAKEVDLFSRLSFSCLPGTLTVLTGPSGAGKSTLMHGILGHAQFDEGLVRIESSQAAPRIGFLAQQVSLLPDCTVYENIVMPLHLQNIQEDTELILNLLKEVCLSDVADRPASCLSGGEIQRVALARVLAQQPAVLLLDEPTNNLDVVTAELVRNLIVVYAQQGGTVLAISHDIELVAKADVVLELKAGKLISLRN